MKLAVTLGGLTMMEYLLVLLMLTMLNMDCRLAMRDIGLLFD
jgi:hypothetical protein